MKNQLLLAVVGGALAVAAPQVQAQATAPLPATPFNPDTDASGNGLINQTGLTANTITVSGLIPEFIQFTSIDNQLEFGNMGGPTNTGLALPPGTQNATQFNGFVASQSGGSFGAGNPGSYVYSSAIGAMPPSGDLNLTPDGKAGVQFRANAYIVIQSRADPMRNYGPDGVAGTSDDIVLPTAYIPRYRGSAKFISTPVFPNTTGFNNNTGYNDSKNNVTGNERGYSVEGGTGSGGAVITSDNTLIHQIAFRPGVPAQFTAPYDTNGYIFRARVARHGLNDYRGNYSAQIRLTYYKF